MLETTLIPSILLLWSLVGFFWLDQVFDYGPELNKKLIQILIAGPFIWILTVSLWVTHIIYHMQMKLLR